MAIGSTRAGFLRLALYMAWTFLCIPVQAALVSLNLPGQARFPRFYHRVCCRLMLALDVDVVGEPSVGRPTLFVSNHSSYLDIPVLGSLVNCSFVAKSEVGLWPLFGLLAKLQRTVFVNRANKREAGKQRDDMAGRLIGGQPGAVPRGHQQRRQPRPAIQDRPVRRGQHPGGRPPGGGAAGQRDLHPPGRPAAGS
ncbi:lysophospholipid acyltransferase family protein [Nitrospirillum sp. BR 11163]|uniref:lysophospholipid acyltransferase family protein n=1 Tax=Nitrospirillum sp. BR 11163 TaxID=3104323 RepID=UPI002AFEEB93|nr:lysophospholipid acyltransferase family protein [Nitrospirillum sp. BR 11163]MEA1677601.1 lysophospholipid acyltransferase family protein [Nitrospirillum sp. BR 11163]